MGDEAYNLDRSARSIRAMIAVDNMPRGLRECVHEYGYAIVHAMVESGVTDPRNIHQLVKEVWAGARQPAQRTGRLGKARSPILDQIDWLLIQSEAGISAERLFRALDMSNVCVVPAEPSPAMVAASLDATNHMGRVTKEQKHRNRLRSAIRAGMARFVPP